MHDLKQTQNDQLYVFGYEPEFLQKLGARYAESPMAAADVLYGVVQDASGATNVVSKRLQGEEEVAHGALLA